MPSLEITPEKFAYYAPGFILSKTSEIAFSLADKIYFTSIYKDDWFPPTISRGVFEFQVLCELCLEDNCWLVSDVSFKTTQNKHFIPGESLNNEYIEAIEACINGWWSSMTAEEQKKAQQKGLLRAVNKINTESAEARRQVVAANSKLGIILQELKKI